MLCLGPQSWHSASLPLVPRCCCGMMRSWEELARASRYPSLDWADTSGTCGARQGRRRRACSVLGAGFLFVTSPRRLIINPGWPSVSKLALSPPQTSPLLSANQTRPDQTQETTAAPTIPQHHRRAEYTFVIGLALIALYFRGFQKHEPPSPDLVIALQLRPSSSPPSPLPPPPTTQPHITHQTTHRVPLFAMDTRTPQTHVHQNGNGNAPATAMDGFKESEVCIPDANSIPCLPAGVIAG